MAKKTATASPRAESAGFTDTRRVKDLIALMAENGLTEIELVEDKSRIVLRRGTMSGSSVSASSAAPAYHAPAPAPTPAAATAAPAPAAAPKAEENLIAIKSPMVGTFYTAANPESDAFVAVGSPVQKDKTVVCIIEAMKVFNEIHADTTGTIAKILVSNGQAVEYGQPLFMVRP